MTKRMMPIIAVFSICCFFIFSCTTEQKGNSISPLQPEVSPISYTDEELREYPTC